MPPLRGTSVLVQAEAKASWPPSRVADLAPSSRLTRSSVRPSSPLHARGRGGGADRRADRAAAAAPVVRAHVRATS